MMIEMGSNPELSIYHNESVEQAFPSNKGPEHIHKTLQGYPGNPIYFNSLGLSLKGQKKLDEAILCFQKAVDINPLYAEAYSNMAIVFQEQGDIDTAISLYHKALELDPNDINAYYNMGVALSGLGKTAQALACYKKVVKINPNDADAYYNMGIALNH